MHFTFDMERYIHVVRWSYPEAQRDVDFFRAPILYTRLHISITIDSFTSERPCRNINRQQHQTQPCPPRQHLTIPSTAKCPSTKASTASKRSAARAEPTISPASSKTPTTSTGTSRSSSSTRSAAGCLYAPSPTGSLIAASTTTWKSTRLLAGTCARGGVLPQTSFGAMCVGGWRNGHCFRRCGRRSCWGAWGGRGWLFCCTRRIRGVESVGIIIHGWGVVIS